MSDCWEWPAGRTSAGYGITRIRKRPVYAHRWSWEQTNGPIPVGMFVLHHCDNPPCVRPSHLFLGTNQDNRRDAMSKGRGSQPPHYYGEQHHNHRLTLAQARAIKQDRRILREVAATYGVSIPTVHSIRAGKTWRDA